MLEFLLKKIAASEVKSLAYRGLLFLNPSVVDSDQYKRKMKDAVVFDNGSGISKVRTAIL